MPTVESRESVEQTLVVPIERDPGGQARAARPVALLQGSEPDFSKEINSLLQSR